MMLFLSRKIGRLLRGRTTPFQIVAATVLGLALGFVPSFGQAPGLVIALLLAVILLNANLFLFGLSAILGKLLGLGLTPLSFLVGRLLLDGPLQPFFRTLINAPVLAFFGLETYVVTGGLMLSLTLGAIFGLVLLAGIRRSWRKMASLESDSVRYEAWTSRRWVRTVNWLFLGGKAKESYTELLARRRIGNPIRPLGAVAVGLAAMLMVVVYFFFTGPLVTIFLRAGLEQANGATVDLASAEVNLAQSRMTLRGLAMADPNALDTDLFRAETLQGAIAGADLLRKRLTLDHLEVHDARTGAPRQIHGRIVGKRPVPPDPPAGEGQTLEDYLEQARLWKERLSQVRHWLEKIAGPASDETVEPGQPQPTTRPNLRDWLEDQVAREGYRQVRAEHLIEGAPTLLVRRLTATGVRMEQYPEETLAIEATSLSTHPNLVSEPPTLRITSSQDSFAMNLSLPGAARLAPGQARPPLSQLNLNLQQIQVDRVAKGLKIGDRQALQGGTFNLAIAGDFSPDTINLPLQIILQNTQLALSGSNPRNIQNLPLTIGLRGPMDNPRLAVDSNQLMQGLVAAGAGELADKAREEANKALERAGDRIGGELNEGLRGLLGGRKKQEAGSENP